MPPGQLNNVVGLHT